MVANDFIGVIQQVLKHMFIPTGIPYMVIIMIIYLSNSSPTHRYPVALGSWKSTEFSEHTESHDIARCSVGGSFVPSDAIMTKATSSAIVSDDLRCGEGCAGGIVSSSTQKAGAPLQLLTRLLLAIATRKSWSTGSKCLKLPVASRVMSESEWTCKDTGFSCYNTMWSQIWGC